jgi:hypothetical protein
MASRPSFVQRNRYQPTEWQKRKAKRGYIKGTRMTVKLPGDYIITENGQVYVIDPIGRMIPKEA